MNEMTELQERVAAALAEARERDQERNDRLAAINAAGELRVALHDAEKQRLQEERQEAFRQRNEARQQEAHERLRRSARASFVGTDADFDRLWPSILERITAQQVLAQRHRPQPF